MSACLSVHCGRADYDALSHIADHRQRVYAAMVLALDRAVGRVLRAVRDSGLEDNTLIVFTSDNGGPHYVGLKVSLMPTAHS
jgi:arylsulfatase A-like enzyme